VLGSIFSLGSVAQGREVIGKKAKTEIIRQEIIREVIR